MSKEIEIESPFGFDDLRENYPELVTLDKEKDEVKTMISTVKKGLQEIYDKVKGTESDGWKETYNKKGLIKKVKDIDNIHYVRGEGTIHASPEEIIRLIGDIRLRSKWDKTGDFNTGTVLGEVTEWATLSRVLFNGQFMVQQRDFVLAGGYTKIEKDYMMVARSVEYSGYGEQKKTTRAKLHSSDWYLTPNEEGTECHAIYIAAFDLCGRIPQKITNRVCNSQPELVTMVDNYFKKIKK
ncbi:hypothetical protein M0813_26585 [Anaeramoeba flamelloides]|uniref:START domain-containing protein n=1 Tax=Anaeramoeba flamelloides TaxID=1746091 RepID=A0AAV7YKG3_9EUKA|nr:hypothetical protein M0812_25705 [Anaeramoeba flamelloides]KAJ6237792.1 hypothetical protein M0813_26585 [Anaeramoeba flamelloides]